MPRSDRDDRDDRRGGRDRDDDRRDDRRGSSRDRDDDRGRDRDDGRGRGRDDRDDRRSGRDPDRDDDRGGGGTKYEYRGRSSEEVNRRASQSSGRYDQYLNKDVKNYKAKVGENCVRIIGWLNGADPDYDKLAEKYGTHWGIDAKIHRNVGVDGNTYLCLEKMFGQPCPVCDIYKEDGDDQLKISDRMFCWVVDRNDEKAGVQFWNMPLGSSKDISSISKVRGKGSDAGAAVMIDDPEQGYDLIFDREGEKDRTRFKNFTLDRQSSPLSESKRKQDEWLGYVADNRIPDLLKPYEADYIEKVLSGQVSRRESGDDTDDSRDRRSSRRDRDDDRGSSRRGGGDRDDGSDRRRGSERDDDRGQEREDDNRESRGSRRGSDRDADENFSRPSRRGRDDDKDSRDGDKDDRDREDTRDREDDARGSRRGSDRDDDNTSRRRGDPGDDRGGKTERYRGRDKDDDKDKGDDRDVDAAKERLKGVGKRRRGDD